MQIRRLFEMVYLLTQRESMTAAEFAERFEISVRTVYRDIDLLSGAGIPIYASRGKGGGIHLLKDFMLERSLLSEREQNEILASLESVTALNAMEAEPVLTKLAALFRKKPTHWLDIDFSHWGGGTADRARFELLKQAILSWGVVTFDYYGISGQKTTRAAEPLRLLFKGLGWYLYAYCRTRGAYRLFKVGRMKNLSLTGESFAERDYSAAYEDEEPIFYSKTTAVVLRFNKSLAFRVYDEFDENQVALNEDGSFTVMTELPLGEWSYGYLLSYGENAEVLSPLFLRERLAEIAQQICQKYE